jgi:Ca-activated chloride channel family protein
MKTFVPLALLLGAGIVGAAAPKLQNPPTFGGGIEIINLNISVTDAQNRYVTNLDQKDFAVYEDGVRQELSLFTHEDLPISMAVMMDTSASMDEKLAQAQAAAIRFVKTGRQQDLSQIVEFNDRATVLQDFTSDQTLLEAAIKKTRASGPTALHNALYIALKDLEKQKSGTHLRRRAIVLLSDGEDTASLITDDQVLDLARKTEIAIYPIALRSGRVQDREKLAFSQAEHLMAALAHESGGQSFFPNSLSELDAVYSRIAEELRSEYSLGYVSNNRRRDGKWRRIVVRVPERTDVQIRHKLGYYAPPV